MSVTVSESGFSVVVSSPGEGSVSVIAESANNSVPVTGDSFDVSVNEYPSPRVVSGGDIPTEYVRSVSVGTGPLTTSIDASNNVTVSHGSPGATGLQYEVFPTSIFVDSTGHVRSVTGDASAAAHRTSLGLTTIATKDPANVLTTDNTTSFGRSFANSADAASAKSTLSLGTAASSDTTDFAAATHQHSAASITSDRLDIDRLPQIDTFVPIKQAFDFLSGGAASTSSFTPLADMFVSGARFDGGTP